MVVLSLDGRKEVNDNMRPTANNKGSYDIIAPKFKKLVSERPKDKYYYIRGTFTRDNLDFSEDVLHFANEGFKLTSVEPVVGEEENPYALREEDLPKVFEEYEKLAVQYADMKLKGDGFSFFHFMIDLNQGPCVIKRITGCGAGNEYLAITPSGDIYPCHQFVGNEDFKLGNILDEKIELPKEVTNMFREAHVYAKDECRNCWNKFYCSGGCHANAINFNNDIKVPYKLGCEMQKKRTECCYNDSSQNDVRRKLILKGRMKMIKEFEGIMPEIDESVFVAESADIIGDVKIGKNSSVWYNTVLRGDEHAIRIGENTNIQDGTVVHVGLDVDTVIGDNVTVGHNALVHGCKIGNNSLVGMGAIVLNGAEIGEFCMIGAGALVTQNKKFPDGMLIIGSPAKAVRELTEEEKQSLIKSADDYCANAQKHK